MPAYWVARSKINDPVEYKKYTDRVPAIIAKYGGKVLARGGRFQIRRGLLHVEGIRRSGCVPPCRCRGGRDHHGRRRRRHDVSCANVTPRRSAPFRAAAPRRRPRHSR